MGRSILLTPTRDLPGLPFPLQAQSFLHRKREMWPVKAAISLDKCDWSRWSQQRPDWTLGCSHSSKNTQQNILKSRGLWVRFPSLPQSEECAWPPRPRNMWLAGSVLMACECVLWWTGSHSGCLTVSVQSKSICIEVLFWQLKEMD